jgi:hypothetical protein
VVTEAVFTAADWDYGVTGHATVRKYSDGGTLVWGTNLYDALDGSAPNEKAIATDPDGYVYTVNDGVYVGGSDLVEIVKWGTGGSPYVWAVWYQGGTSQNAIAVLPSRNVVYGSARGSDGAGGYRNVTLLDGTDGSERWHKDTGGAQAMAVCADADGNIYAGGTRVGTTSIWAWDESGTALWTADFGALVTGMAVLGEYLYVVGTYNGSAGVRKFALVDGAEVTTGGFPIDTTVSTRAIALDKSGNIYVSYWGATDWLASYSPIGVEQWKVEFDYAPNGVAVSPDGVVYTAADVNTYGADANVRAFNAASGIEDTLYWPKTAETEVNGVAVLPGLIGAFPSYWPPALTPPNIYVGRVDFE